MRLWLDQIWQTSLTPLRKPKKESTIIILFSMLLNSYWWIQMWQNLSVFLKSDKSTKSDRKICEINKTLLSLVYIFKAFNIRSGVHSAMWVNSRNELQIFPFCFINTKLTSVSCCLIPLLSVLILDCCDL